MDDTSGCAKDYEGPSSEEVDYWMGVFGKDADDAET